METPSIRLLVCLIVTDGHLDALRRVAAAMTQASRSEPGTLEYESFLSADGKRCRTFESFTDSAALLAHFAGPVVKTYVPQLLEHCRVERLEVYGDLNAEAGALLAGLGALVHVPLT